ncbi:MAG: hypothetical protein ACM3MF_03715, partial [Anaerolineae bacterium]
MNEHKLTVRAQMADAGGPAPDRFEIVFLLAGEANDWSFSPQVLEDSARLWEGCSVFVDHSAWGMRSVRDLGGVLSGVSFDAENNGLTATLKCTGPSAEIVQQAAAEMLAPGPHPDIGFSADVIFTADAHNHVTKIVQPLSVDLVIDPAFATRFIRQLNHRIVEEAQPSAGKESYMTDPNVTPKADDTAALLAAQQVELCKQLVNLKLSNAELPPAAEAEIRARFDGRSFAPGELDGAVRAWKEGLAAADAPAEIHGPRRASQMFDSRDQVQAALDDLIGAPREKGAENLQAAPFSGIREAYIMGTGDRDFIGGFHGEHARFSLTAASFPGLLVNSLNKALARHWETLGRARYDWWQKIVTVEHFNTLNDITWVLFGSVGALPTVAENGEYTELKIGDSAETSSFVKRGGYIGLSLEAMDKDDTRMLRAIPRELAAAALRNISARVAEIFTSASSA